VVDRVLELRGVCKTYGRGQAAQEVLHGVDLDLAGGEFSALIGPSGSGKSTLLNLVGLLDRPTAGSLTIVGEETSKLEDAALTRLRGRSIGFIFQYHNLIAAFSALENVMMPLLVAQGRPTPQMQERAAELLRLVGLERFKNQRTDELSGGQQQRVAIARALAADPPLVLADEPTGNLDTKSADGVFQLMRDVNAHSGTTFLIVTHDPRLAQRCDRIVELVDGRIVNDRARPEQGWESSAGATL